MRNRAVHQYLSLLPLEGRGSTMLPLLILLATALVVQPITVDEYKKLPVEKDFKDMTGQEAVDYINSHQTFYKAAYKPGIEEFVQSRLMKSKYLDDPLADKLMPRIEPVGDDPLPESFDPRDKWTKCAKIIGHIRDQSNCGSCWAVANTEVMSDRVCIQTDAKYTVHISDTDLLACCGSYCGYGCEGGYTARGWTYFTSSGICTGGPYGDKNCCKPYAFYPCGKHENQTYYGPCPWNTWDTPACRNQCQLKYRKREYEDDKFWGNGSYYVAANETAIRREIYNNGPVLVSFRVYSDFSYYKGGVYIQKSGYDQGGHAVKMVGWGVDKTGASPIPYWLVANSWNVDWGENGFFRIIRGTNECNIEGNVIGGRVNLKKLP
ncbi:unnamed protein product [Cylicocyclus nassatus]|uniref:Peptidase C1A papain C-terminal domain-containing protein n=1 Tax=Cylicocyclus nassatus TaxID=53992 RepID=A0AA36GMG5_CYLNA|nr:unnamed protein product [Cylicocyclus nassatus]